MQLIVIINDSIINYIPYISKTDGASEDLLALFNEKVILNT